MNPRPLTVTPGTMLAEAKAIMQRYWVRHLPVAEGEVLVGMLSDRDIRMASLPPGPGHTDAEREARLGRVAVRDAMTQDPRTVGPDAPLLDVARFMLEHRFGGVPVLDGGRLVGIITETDILRAFIKMVEGAGAT
ncbi:MAG TPA: CBS domain-containing protein [Candidatus Methylomirabilis sp.]